jgi:hypothetical protein
MLRTEVDDGLTHADSFELPCTEHRFPKEDRVREIKL